MVSITTHIARCSPQKQTQTLEFLLHGLKLSTVKSVGLKVEGLGSWVQVPRTRQSCVVVALAMARGSTSILDNDTSDTVNKFSALSVHGPTMTYCCYFGAHGPTSLCKDVANMLYDHVRFLMCIRRYRTKETITPALRPLSCNK